MKRIKRDQKPGKLVLEGWYQRTARARLFLTIFVAIAGVVGLSLAQSFAGMIPKEELRLVPFPKEVQVLPGGLKLSGSMRLELTECVPAQQAALGLNAELAQRLGGGLKFSSGKSAADLPYWLGLSNRRLSPRKLRQALGELPPGSESYGLVVRDGFAAVAAREAAGLAHGIQTLRQLVRANLREGRVTALNVRDWPSLQYRGFSDDITRGPSPTLDTLKREVELSAFLRMNCFTYYLEHQYAFAKNPLIGPTDGSLKPEELKALVAYAADRGIEIIGNQQSFGHFGNILRHERYADLRETGDVLNPTNEKTYQLLDELYSEQAPLLPSPFFNVCCDETEGLGTGPSKALAEKIGVGGVYTRHLRRIHDLLKQHYGKRMLMWGDIILNHPANLPDIPKDTILLSWGYDARGSFGSQITPFAKSGYEFFVCPGVSCWSRILPDFQVAVTNIANFVRDGARQNALGMLNTTWDDDGENLAGPNWYGIAWGAECAWNASATPIEVFNRRVGAALFGEDNAAFGQAIQLLGTAHRLSAFEGMADNVFWKTDFGRWVKDENLATQAKALQENIGLALAELDACRKAALVNRDILDEFIFGAERMRFLGMRITEGRLAVAAYQTAAVAPSSAETAGQVLSGCAEPVRKIAAECGRLRGRYIELWNRENRPYALETVTRRYDAAIGYYEGVAKRLETAAEDLKRGRPLPPIETIGLLNTSSSGR